MQGRCRRGFWCKACNRYNTKKEPGSLCDYRRAPGPPEMLTKSRSPVGPRHKERWCYSARRSRFGAASGRSHSET